jgi:hypothetical protein
MSALFLLLHVVLTVGSLNPPTASPWIEGGRP